MKMAFKSTTLACLVLLVSGLLVSARPRSFSNVDNRMATRNPTGRILESWVASEGRADRTLKGFEFPFAIKKESPSPSPTVVVKKESPSPSPVVVKKVVVAPSPPPPSKKVIVVKKG